jgi:hypothetical protein
MPCDPLCCHIFSWQGPEGTGIFLGHSARAFRRDQGGFPGSKWQTSCWTKVV